MRNTVAPSLSIGRVGRKHGKGYRASRGMPWGNPVVYFLSLVLVAICVVPVLYIVFGGFRTNAQITNNPSGLPHPWVLDNYATVITSEVFWQEMANSIIVGLCTMAGVVVLGIMVSFVIARYRFRYAGALYALFAAGLMFPMTVGITPLYLLIRNLGLSNSLAGIVIPQIAFGLPQTIIILVPFLKTIPHELEEACLIDGCSRLGFFWRMALPLAMPGVATTGILTFVGSWNSYMLPLFVLSSSSKYTLPLGVQAFSSEHSVDTAQVLAFTSLAMLPALVCFTVFQKRIVGGLTGAVKG